MEKFPELFDLTGRVAVVTGGAGLLGAELQFNKRDRSQGTSQRALGIQTDISSKDSVQQMVAKALSVFNRLDILVNGAALDPKFDHQQETNPEEDKQAQRQDDPLSINFEDYPLDLWNQALEVNLTGMFLCCQVAGKQMIKQGRGVIINVSSIYGLVGPDQRIYQKQDEPPQYKPAYYSVTKAGVIGLTSYLASYYAGKGIRVNALTPGGVYNGHDDTFLKAYSDRTLMGRMAEKNEMNGALLFLASDASSYMTGGNLVVDGGWTAW
jgi:2-deoxy-D-gluconate 3-dehydrogenase